MIRSESGEVAMGITFAVLGLIAAAIVTVRFFDGGGAAGVLAAVVLGGAGWLIGSRFDRPDV